MMGSVNILLTTFAGVSLSQSLCFQLPSSTTSEVLLESISNLLPPRLSSKDYVVTTTTNCPIRPSSSITLAALLPEQCSILPLRLSALLKGGKGGFGSQLRAAGGRMSSRKKRNTTDPNGSNRNLDGRRLRTITEAKNLAAYLAIKPEMDRKEKEERRRRWEAVVEMAEKKEEDMRRGIGADGRRRGLSDEWVESKEGASEGVRNAVAAAMKRAAVHEKQQETSERERSGSSGTGSESGRSREASDPGSDDEEVMELDDHDMARLKAEAEAGDIDAIWVMKNQLKMEPPPVKTQNRKFDGFDEDDEFLSSDEEEAPGNAGKGKERAKD